MDIESLPNDARIKLSALQQRRDERKAAKDAIGFAIRECEARCTRLANLARSAGSAEARADFLRKLEAARDEHQRLTQQRNTRDAEMRSADNDCNRAEDFVLRLPADSKLRVVARRPTSYSPEKLVTVRSDIANLHAKLHRVEMAPLDRESQKAIRARDFDAVLAGFLVEESPFLLKLATRTGTLRELTWLESEWWRYPEQRGALLDRLVPEVPDGMTAEAKADARARLGARLLTAERAEEAVIEAAEQARVGIERRPDCSPLAVLGIALIERNDASEDAVAA